MASKMISSNREVKDIKYGAFNSNYNGCGWIAVYNALVSMGINVIREKVAADMSKALPLGGIFGTPFSAVCSYLKQYGVIFQISTAENQYDDYIKDFDAGILYHNIPPLKQHYTMVEYLPAHDTCRFYNPCYGRMTVWQYLKKVGATDSKLILLKRR